MTVIYSTTFVTTAETPTKVTTTTLPTGTVQAPSVAGVPTDALAAIREIYPNIPDKYVLEEYNYWKNIHAKWGRLAPDWGKIAFYLGKRWMMYPVPMGPYQAPYDLNGATYLKLVGTTSLLNFAPTVEAKYGTDISKIPTDMFLISYGGRPSARDNLRTRLSLISAKIAAEQKAIADAEAARLAAIEAEKARLAAIEAEKLRLAQEAEKARIAAEAERTRQLLLEQEAERQREETNRLIQAENVHLLKFSDSSVQYDPSELTQEERDLEAEIDSSAVPMRLIVSETGETAKTSTAVKIGGLAVGAFVLWQLFSDD